MKSVGGRSRPWIAILAIACSTALLGPPAVASAAPGDFTQAQVDTAIANGVNFLASKQKPDGSFDTGAGFPEAETSLAIISYGVLSQGNSSSLSAEHQAELGKAVDYLLAQQQPSGAFTPNFLKTYSTGLALLALSYVTDLQSGTRDVAGAIAKGRHFLIMTQNAPPSVTGNTGSEAPTIPGPSPDCSPTDAQVANHWWCGGWDYSPSFSRSDQSNTGFALTGLAATSGGGVTGVPPAAQAINAGWQHNVQMLNGNPFLAGSTSRNGAAPNDGGGAYTPFSTSGNFSSNANDTGSLIFGYAYDGVPASDAGAAAAIAFGQQVLDVYELSKDVPNVGRSMVYHSSATLDGACVVDSTGCNWNSGKGEGGYHYSMFALSKGLGQYLPSSLTDKGNFYAKVVDLLLSEQSQTDGSWPNDPRDDGSIVGSTAFAIMSLGRVGQPPIVKGTVYNDANGNGTRDSGEAGLAGWVVYVDSNGNGAFDAGEPSATTAADGTYTIQNLKEGTVAIREVGQSGFTCTAPAGCAYPNTKLTLGQTVDGRDFGNRQPPPPVVVISSSVPKACASVRHFTIRVRRYSGETILSVSITVNGKKVAVRKRNGRFTAAVNLKTLPKGRYEVHLTIKLRKGKSKKVHTVKYTRRYRTCTPHVDSGPPTR